MNPARASTGDVWIGVDFGTQSVRVLALRDDGTVSGAGSHPIASTRDGNRHEQRAEDWWQAFCVATREALSTTRTDAIRGLAVAATSGTLLLADASGRALTPALMYDDSRAARECDHVNQAGQALWHELGYQRMQPSWALPKLVWLLRTCSGTATGTRAMHQNDYINRHLIGTVTSTDLSNALKTGADLIHEQWPQEVMAELGVPPQILPPLTRSGSVIGTVGLDGAAATTIPQGTPVIAGTTDGCAAQLGAGVCTPGSWNAALGTTLILKGITRERLSDPSGAVYSHRAPDGNWLPGGASSTGAGAISLEYEGRNLQELDSRARTFDPAAIVRYPLAGIGERFPFVAPQAHAFVLGEARDESERYAAILQGVAFIERLAFDHLDMLGAPIEAPIVLTGGATRSKHWCQLRADVLGRPLTIPRNAEPALGAAMLATTTTTGEPIASVVERIVRTRMTIAPRAKASERYHAPYLRLVDELEKRGWLPHDLARHARARTGR